ncbi:MAG TPA: acyltransferase [Pseudomonadales bacterium]|nr:acyltransferase [Pseudomonadales bacterium]
MLITVTNIVQSTWIVIASLLTVTLLTFRKTGHTGLLPIPVTQELKGLGILAIVFAHISYMLVTDNTFLYPLSIAAGVGVDLFLFMSGFGLTVGMLKKQMPTLEFYQRRLVKIFIPFWIVLVILFACDKIFLNIHYSFVYMLQSFFGWFPRASAFEDVNSPFWYISWMLMFYALFPLLFRRESPWLTAILLAVIANTVALIDPLHLQVNWLHRLHTNAFSLGILLAWWLHANPSKVEMLEWFRNQSSGLGRYAVVTAALIFAGYMAYHNTAGNWPRFASLLETTGFDPGFFIGQATSLICMAALIVVFSLKKFDNKFLYIYGIYSYETYLLHWPLMSRYDIFFHYLPAWAATILWVAAFIGIGWLLQKITTPVGAWVDKL